MPGGTYRYFLFINASVRGPFLHPAMTMMAKQIAGWEWPRVFTDSISDEVKLVGTTVNCCEDWCQRYIRRQWLAVDAQQQQQQQQQQQGEISSDSSGSTSSLSSSSSSSSSPPFPGVAEEGASAASPAVHMQSMALATDGIGLSKLLDAGIFSCSTNKWETIVRSEIGASRTILEAGFNLAAAGSLYWTGHDFRDSEATALKCAAMRHGPQARRVSSDAWFPGGLYDGIDYQPLETIFFKANRGVSETVLDRHTAWARQQAAQAAADAAAGH